MTPTARRARTATAGLALLALALSPLAVQSAQAADPSAPVRSTTSHLARTIGDPVSGLADLDGAGAAVAPTAAQKGAAGALGSGVSVQWSSAGTPSSIFARDGVLAPAVAGQAPVDAARAWIAAHRDVLGISAAQEQGLQLVSDQKLADSPARAVLFRQQVGGLVPATRGMVTVGVAANGAVAYVSSSLLKPNDANVPAVVLSPQAGWLKAAANVGRSLTAADLASITSSVSDGWTRLTVPGFDQTQLARTRAFVKNDGTVRPVVESDVIDTSAGTSTAYRIFVDAVDGSVLLRQNAVENSNDAFPFQGTYGPGKACSQVQAFALTDNATKTIAVAAAAVVAADDITITISGPGPGLPANYDLTTSPEVATYSPGTALPQGTYGFKVCGFDATAIGGPFAANVITSDVATTAPTTGLPKPRWRAFAANPDLSTVFSTTGAPGNSVIECWFATTDGCSAKETHENVAAFGPWDQINGVPTLTTIGNNANTHEAWGSFLTPGGLEQAPYSATRDYTTPFTDVWNNSKCDPTNLVPGGNDINAVVTNLFTGHNRIHDFAYYLGFTESNYNLQLDNGGRGGAGGDQEIGNVQAGALTGGAAGQYMGRDNANQIALQDGVPGITNQYLFQPIAGAFYSPCTDGAMDTGIYGHEYTHAISNRMVGGPDDGLTSNQGGAMGESWSDLNAAEYQFENDYPTGTNPWSLGSYTTGNFSKGIRDYAINDNPLNYGDYGFDTTGAEVHADGEIWNGTLWEVRQALVNTWDAAGYKYADTALQEQCSEATKTTTPTPAANCPGNRRWLQLIFDAWLLQPGATDMLQARNAMLAADQMRFGGANQAVIASAFARRGMGADASTPTPDSEDVTPSFRSAYGSNSAVTFTSTTPGKVYVGNYEARATPIADTDASTPLTATSSFTPGVYRMTFVSPTAGFRRFVLTVPDTGVSFSQAIDDSAANVAAFGNGASIITGATTAGSLNAVSLIDGTESTNWAGKVTSGSIDDAAAPGVGVAVSLAGGLQTISSAKVSALLRPAPASATDLPLLVDGAQADDDPDSASRFTALRKFALQACTTDCSNPANYTTFFTSADDAFPGDVPRPVAPDQTMRTFTFAPVQAAAVRLVALENQCTGQAKYAGEQDDDPLNSTDCKTASDRGSIVHAAELQVFGSAIPTDPAQGTPGDGNPGSGDAGQGTNAPPVAGQSSIATTAKAGVKQLVKTRTRIRLPKVQPVQGQKAVKLLYQVVAKVTSNGAKAGVATIRIDEKLYKKVKIAVTLKHGKKVIGKRLRLPRSLGVGKHVIQVKFKSADKTTFSSSKSRRIVVTVVRHRG